MRVCPSCGGILGRDCFNPEECQWITDQMARQDREDFEANKHHLQEPQCPEPHSPSLPETDQPVPQEGAIPKMSNELAAMADMAAIEYGQTNGQRVCREEDDYDNSPDLTEAFEAGQNWMYRRQQATIADLQSRLSQTEAERDAYKKAFEEQAEELKSVRQKAQEYLKGLEFFSRKTGISIPILLDASQKPEAPEKKARSKKQQ